MSHAGARPKAWKIASYYLAHLILLAWCALLAVTELVTVGATAAFWCAVGSVVLILLWAADRWMQYTRGWITGAVAVATMVEERRRGEPTAFELDANVHGTGMIRPWAPEPTLAEVQAILARVRDEDD